MIKSFEQFVAECYNKKAGKSVNEAFQSSKLREIIKQHGKPKYDFEKKLLYDLQDDEIVDVVDSREEYWKKYSNRPEDPIDRSEATFMLELKDGACVVISNLGVLKSYFDRDFEGEMKKEIEKRHAERHKGNLGKFGGDEIHKKHMENVSKLERRRLAEYLQENQKEIVDTVKYLMDKIVVSEWLDGEDTDFSSEIIIDGEEFNIYMYCSVECSDIRKEYGEEYFDAYFTLDHFEIENEDGNFTTNEDLGITEETYKDLFEPIVKKDIEGDIYDHYEYYGVSRSDFY